MTKKEVISVTVTCRDNDEVDTLVFGKYFPVEAKQVIDAMELDFVRLCQKQGHRYEVNRSDDYTWIHMKDIASQTNLMVERIKIEDYKRGTFDFLYD